MTYGSPSVAGRRVDLAPFQTPDGRRLHFAERYLRNLCVSLGIPEFDPVDLHPEIFLTEGERNPGWLKMLGIDGPFWVMMAGGNSAMTHKWWNPESYQAVVDHFAGRIQFVQAGYGGDGDFHLPLRGVVNVVGKTNEARRFMSLIYQSSGVVSPVTAAMHIAAAFHKPAVVIGGGRENPFFYTYPGHLSIGTIGELKCCEHTGCMKYKCCVPAGDKCDDPCEHPVRIGVPWKERPVIPAAEPLEGQKVDRIRPVGVFSLATDDWIPLRDLTWPSLRGWAERHGYTFHGETQAEPGRHPSWSKIPLLRRHLDRFEWLLWIDADAIIGSPELDLRPYMFPDADMVIAADDISGVNCGVMLFRSCEATAKLLDMIWNTSPDVHNSGWWEQESLRRIIGARGGTPASMAATALAKTGIRMKIIGPRDPFNCFVQWAANMPSPLIVHAPSGNGMEWKLQALKAILDRGSQRGVVIPECMHSIGPARVIEAMETFLPHASDSPTLSPSSL